MQSVYQTIMLNYNNKQWIGNYMERSGRDPFSGRIWVMPRKLFGTARLCYEIQLGSFLFITINFGIYTGVSIVLGKTRDWRLFHFIVTKFEFSRSSQTISFEQILYKRLPVNPLEKKTGHQLRTCNCVTSNARCKFHENSRVIRDWESRVQTHANRSEIHFKTTGTIFMFDFGHT